VTSDITVQTTGVKVMCHQGFVKPDHITRLEQYSNNCSRVYHPELNSGTGIRNTYSVCRCTVEKEIWVGMGFNSRHRLGFFSLPPHPQLLWIPPNLLCNGYCRPFPQE